MPETSRNKPAKYAVYHPLYMSFYSRELYRAAGLEWNGVAFGYLLFLLALCWIPITGRVQSMVGSAIEYGAPKIVEQIPRVSIKGGRAGVDAPMPHVIKDPDTGRAIAILDTTGATTSLEGSEALLLLTADELVLKKGETETSAYKLATFSDRTIDKKTVYGWLAAFRKWSPFVMYPLALFFSYAYRIVQVLLYGLIGMLFARALGVGLGYKALVRLSVVAVTPAVILNAVVLSAMAAVPYWGLLCFLITVGYLYYGIVACAGREDAA